MGRKTSGRRGWGGGGGGGGGKVEIRREYGDGDRKGR